METTTFTLNGTQHRLTRAQVVAAMKGQIPGTIQVYAVEVNGQWFPPKQVLAQALQIKASEFITTRAQDILGKLDFRIVDVESEPDYESPQRTPAGLKPEHTASDDLTVRRTALELAVTLHGSSRVDAQTVLDTATAFANWMAEGSER